MALSKDGVVVVVAAVDVAVVYEFAVASAEPGLDECELGWTATAREVTTGAACLPFAFATALAFCNLQ